LADKIAEGLKDWWKVLEARAMSGADPINPQRVFWELSSRLPDKAIINRRFRLGGQLVSRAT